MTKVKQLLRDYFLNEDVLYLAKDLLGKSIQSSVNGQMCSAIITETEAYKAPEDKASHAYGNKRTSRTQIMFGKGGFSYVYLIYGIHHLFNIVTGPPYMAHAVLIRAVIAEDNMEVMLKRRGIKGKVNGNHFCFKGPGKLTQALGISKEHNAMDLCSKNSKIKIFDSGKSYNDDQILKGPRIGIDYAEEWTHVPWRFWLNSDSF